jgi:hypothetical protein
LRLDEADLDRNLQSTIGLDRMRRTRQEEKKYNNGGATSRQDKTRKKRNKEHRKIIYIYVRGQHKKYIMGQ